MVLLVRNASFRLSEYGMLVRKASLAKPGLWTSQFLTSVLRTLLCINTTWETVYIHFPMLTIMRNTSLWVRNAISVGTYTGPLASLLSRNRLHLYCICYNIERLLRKLYIFTFPTLRIMRNTRLRVCDCDTPVRAYYRLPCNAFKPRNSPHLYCAPWYLQ